MKKILILLVACLSACGYSQTESEAIGQVKKVANVNDIFCSRRVDTDISLGVMVNGVGSMSSQDLWLTVKDKTHIATLKKANETGKLVKFKYDVARLNWCWNDHELTEVEILK